MKIWLIVWGDISIESYNIMFNSEVALAPWSIQIFENLHISVDQVYFLEFNLKKYAISAKHACLMCDFKKSQEP